MFRFRLTRANKLNYNCELLTKLQFMSQAHNIAIQATLNKVPVAVVYLFHENKDELAATVRVLETLKLKYKGLLCDMLLRTIRNIVDNDFSTFTSAKVDIDGIYPRCVYSEGFKFIGKYFIYGQSV